MLWQLSVETSPDAEEAVAALLERLFGARASVFAQARNRSVTVSVHARRLPFEPRRTTEAAKAGLQTIRACGLPTWPGRVDLRRLPRRAWAMAWKEHFPPLEVGRALLIRPSWSRRRTRAGEALVVLDPGLSFGTGQHATTRFCLDQIVACRTWGRAQALLDLGTGSGILAIAGAKLGYRPVEAWDCDPVAVRVARANARRNRVAPRLRIARREVAELRLAGERRYDVIAANLTAGVLVRHRTPLIASLREGGHLILAGILRSEFDRVERAYAVPGLRRVGSRSECGWRSALYRRRA